MNDALKIHCLLYEIPIFIGFHPEVAGVYKPPFSPPSRGGENISPLSEQGRKLAVFLKKNKRQMPEHKEEE